MLRKKCSLHCSFVLPKPTHSVPSHTKKCFVLNLCVGWNFLFIDSFISSHTESEQAQAVLGILTRISFLFCVSLIADEGIGWHWDTRDMPLYIFGRTELSLPIVEQTPLHYFLSEDILHNSNVPSQRIHLQDDQFKHAMHLINWEGGSMKAANLWCVISQLTRRRQTWQENPFVTLFLLWNWPNQPNWLLVAVLFCPSPAVLKG